MRHHSQKVGEQGLLDAMLKQISAYLSVLLAHSLTDGLEGFFRNRRKNYDHSCLRIATKSSHLASLI
jgi:hypothetical protein